MNPEIYYHILELGVIYEKGGKQGSKWRVGERKRLLDECELWRHLLQYASMEEAGVDCSGQAFADLAAICKKRELPVYERVLSLRAELMTSTHRYVVSESDKNVIVERMTEAIDEIERSVSDPGGKPNAYKVMHRLHNMPKALHGSDELGRGTCVTVQEALEWGT